MVKIMEYDIRSATVMDLEFIGEQLEETCELHHHGRSEIFKPNGRKYSDQDIIEILEREDVFIDICESDEGIRLGYCIQFLRETDEDGCRFERRTLFIDDIYVITKKRSKGVGKALMYSAKQRAEKLGCAAVELNVWEFNKDAISFYESLGYVPQRRILELKLSKE